MQSVNWLLPPGSIVSITSYQPLTIHHHPEPECILPFNPPQWQRLPLWEKTNTDTVRNPSLALFRLQDLAVAPFLSARGLLVDRSFVLVHFSLLISADRLCSSSSFTPTLMQHGWTQWIKRNVKSNLAIINPSCGNTVSNTPSLTLLDNNSHSTGVLLVLWATTQS